MAGLPVGIGVFDYTLNKFYDKIPNKAFAGETYKNPIQTLKGNSESSGSGRRNSRRDSRDDDNQNNDSDRSRKYKGAAAGAAGGYAADELYDDYRQPEPRRRSEDDERNYNYNNQDYEPDPNSKTQGDPNFGRRNRSRTLDGQNENDNGGRNRGGNMSRQDQQQQYYDQPRTNDRHRYNPRDYEPQQGYNSDYAPARYNEQQDPYNRPQTAEPREDVRRERREARERRDGRERRKSRDSRNKSRDSSPEGVKGYKDVRDMMKKNFEMSDTGLTTGALGALAGGIIAHEVGKGMLSTVAGALIGGLGANAWEARDHRKQIETRVEEKRQKERRKFDDNRRGPAYDDRHQPQSSNGPNSAYNNAYGQDQNQNRGPTLDQVQARGISRGDDGSGADDSGEERRRRKAARAQRRAAKEEMKRRAEMGDGSLPWGDVLRY